MRSRLTDDAILERLKRLHPRVIDLSLARVERLLARLGDPHRQLPPVIHVAGTNGKGSTIAFLKAILTAAGRRVHAYTSPHLLRFNERIVVAGEEIADDNLAALLEACETANEGEPITFFEITTAAAFLAFARAPADVTLLETGLGGRLDATNVVDKPLATLITPIALDHQAYLGDTIAAIAGEKAGILKANTPCLMTAQAAEAERVIRERARELGAPLFREGVGWSAEATTAGLRVRFGQRLFDLPPPSLPGRHQVTNAGLAVATLLELTSLGVDLDAIAEGLRTAEWPARLQRLSRGPLVALLPADWEAWLDGGHNPAAGVALATHARAWRDRPLDLVFGMLSSKDAVEFLTPLRPLVRRLVAVAIPGEPASLGAEEAAAIAEGLGYDAMAAPSIPDALALLAKDAEPPSRVLICGSLYLAGAVLKANAERTAPPTAP